MSAGLDRYIDIRLIPNTTYVPVELLSVVFSKLHLRLVDIKCNRIGISFPEFSNVNLRTLLRIHGCESDLVELMKVKWWRAASSYLAISEIEMVPPSCSFRTVSRIQSKSNPERLRLCRSRWSPYH